MMDLNQYILTATDFLDKNPAIMFAVMVVTLTMVIYLLKKLWRIVLVSSILVGAFFYIYSTNMDVKKGVDRKKILALDEMKKKSEDLRKGIKEKYYKEVPGLK
jgi:hypothetical protein